MNIEEFLGSLEDALEVQTGTIKPVGLLSELGCWDSMAALTFMALVDQKLSISVSGSQVQGCRTVQDLINLLGDKITR